MDSGINRRDFVRGLVGLVGGSLFLGGCDGSVRENGVGSSDGARKEYSSHGFSGEQILAIAMYSEAAVEEERARKVVGRVASNRVDDPGYPDDLYDVVFGGNALSSNGTKNWKQATGELPRNPYEERVFQQCLSHARDLFNGEKLGIPYENEIIAFDDVRSFERVKRERPDDPYWKYMKKVGQEGNIVYCIDIRA